MKPKDRQSKIRDIVAAEGEAYVETLAARFQVSAETIRRDLHDLASTGVLHKVRGGARRLRLTDEGSFEERRFEDVEAKAAVARAVLGAIEPGDTLFVDTGTTTLACASELARLKALTIITNSPRIAQCFGAGPVRHRIFLLGGAWAQDTAETVGPMAIDQIARFEADRAILGVAALDSVAGAMDADADEAHIARAMIDRARQVIIVAHAKKFDRRAAFRVCRLDEIDVLVCDQKPDGDLADALHQARVEIRC